MKNINNCTKKILIILLLLLPLCLSSCPGAGLDSLFIYDLRFSIKNDTLSDLTAELLVGEIPSINARFEEFNLIIADNYNPDYWALEDRSIITINPGKYDYVYNNNFYIVYMDYEINQNISSFIFTIKHNDEILYRVVGWDLPEQDMVTYKIDDSMLGVFDPSQQDIVALEGGFPTIISKLFPDGSSIVMSPTYYILASQERIFLQSINASSLHDKDEDYWE